MIAIAYFVGKQGWLPSSERYTSLAAAQREIVRQSEKERAYGLTPLPRRAVEAAS